MLLTCSFTACHTPAPFADQIPEFRAWYKPALANPEAHQELQRFSQAGRGDKQALHEYFRAARSNMAATEINIEAGEAISSDLVVLARRVGDAAYAEALAKEPEDVRSAVAQTSGLGHLGVKFPRTVALVEAAPERDFPLQQRYRRVAPDQIVRPGKTSDSRSGLSRH